LKTQTIDDLRTTVRKLNATGPDGFEGLIAVVLTELTKRTFALASSGSQRGKDGQSAFDGGAIVFEGKLYEDAVPKDQILSKIAEIAVDEEGQTELWILGSTGPVSAQHLNTARKAGRKIGLEVKVLAWPETGLSEFAALLAMAPAVSADFLSGKTGTPEADVAAQIEAVQNHPQFAARSAELLADLSQPSLAPAYALTDNIAWLSNAFGSKRRARSVFGQPLSPEDGSIPGILDRKGLRTGLAAAVFSKPDGSVAAILGADGNGKSWLFAQAWTHQTPRPLTIIIMPDDVNTPFAIESLQELLITKLLAQTGETRSEASVARWRNHFARWRRLKDADAPRLVVFVDGLNQRETVNWPRFIDAMSELVAELGGRLVFSCRRFFYKDNLEGLLVSRVAPCDVPEWSDEELEALLAPRGTSIQKLNPKVVRSLRNPRIFGVAAELLMGKEIDQFGELSVNRLLFEHIRQTVFVSDGIALSPNQFVVDVRAHADEIITRLRERQNADLTVFDRPNRLRPGQSNQTVIEQFAITSAGRFFEALEDDPGKYALKEEGLSLALGLSLVNSARTALRQEKNVDEALSNILDPIAALDRTSDVLIGAILAAVLEEARGEVIAALVRSFIALQNLDASRYVEFQALLKHNPAPFLAALEDAALTENVTSNLSWLTRAFDDARDLPACAAALKAAVHRWLSMFSPAPERMMTTPRSGAHEEERKKERAKRESEIKATTSAFCQTERDLLATLVLQERGDYSSLNRLAFHFLAGRPLAEYAESLRNWTFAASFNGGYHDHHDEFNNLLQFNLADWSAARRAIVGAAKIFDEPGMSETGLWAMVYLLRATADSEDAKTAEEMAEELTKDREPRPGWRLIENFCATDPCDPSSARPANIDATAEKYAAIDVSALRRHTAEASEDHFFDMARPGLARFRPDAAVATMRRFAKQIATRPVPEFRTAAFLLENHTVALEDGVAPLYVAKAAEIATDALAADDKYNEKYVAAQYSLLIAFPHMSGQAQFDALLAHPKDSTFLRDLGHLFLPCDPAKMETSLGNAIADGNEVAQFRILAFAELSGTTLTPGVKAMVAALSSAKHSHVRLSALGLIRTATDPGLLATLVNSGWSAANLDIVSQGIEMLHGSEGLILAAEKGLLSVESCLERIDLSTYPKLAAFGPDAASAIAYRLTTAIRKAADFKVEGNLPDIEQRLDARYWPSFLEISEKPVEGGQTPQDQLQRLSELSDTGDAWYERRKRSQEAAERFERELSKSGAQLVIQFVSADLIREIDKAAPAVIDVWQEFFMGLDQKALNNVHNIASAVAATISERDPAAGLALFKRLSPNIPHVRVTFGRSQLALDAVSAWTASNDSEMKALRFARLDAAGSDHDLAMEVLAAIQANRENELRDYVFDRRNREEPVLRARAAMVAGLSPAEDWALETIEQLKDKHGFLKSAYNAAKYAMDRHQWSKHWSRLMGAATEPIDLWRYSVLLSKIVDGRFKSSDVEGTTPNPLIARFRVTSASSIRDRINSWKKKRESKLFGMNAPDRVFLAGPTI
jgi:hypothetical protein